MHLLLFAKFAKMSMVHYFLWTNLIKKEDMAMENSQLVAIISRLDAMMKAGESETQSRRFEKTVMNVELSYLQSSKQDIHFGRSCN